MSKPTILLVESDAVESRLFVERYSGCGLRVVAVDCGHGAAEVLTREGDVIDVVVTELAMLKGDGLWLRQWMQTQAAQPPAILTTGAYAGQSPLVRDLFHRVFEKPLGPQQWQYLLSLAELRRRQRVA